MEEEEEEEMGEMERRYYNIGYSTAPYSTAQHGYPTQVVLSDALDCLKC